MWVWLKTVTFSSSWSNCSGASVHHVRATYKHKHANAYRANEIEWARPACGREQSERVEKKKPHTSWMIYGDVREIAGVQIRISKERIHLESAFVQLTMQCFVFDVVAILKRACARSFASVDTRERSIIGAVASKMGYASYSLVASLSLSLSAGWFRQHPLFRPPLASLIRSSVYHPSMSLFRLHAIDVRISIFISSISGDAINW